MSDWLSIDLNNIRDFDFTKIAVKKLDRILDSEEFANMEPAEIYAMLYKNIELISFGQYLRRYIYERAQIKEPFNEVSDSIYKQIIKDCFRENCAPYTFVVTTRRPGTIIKTWLSENSIRREAFFPLIFGLRMTLEDASEFLTKVLLEEDFDYSSPEETVYMYCCRFQKGYSYAHNILKTFETMPGNDTIMDWKEIQQKKDFEKNSEKYLLEYLASLKNKTKKKDNAYTEFCLLYDRCRQMIADITVQDFERKDISRSYTMEEITPADVEKMLCSGIPVGKSGNLEKAKDSKLALQFKNRRMSRQRISGILDHKMAVERFDLISLLFLLYAQTVERNWPTERYLSYIDEINEILHRCEMMEIYPANPYEAVILLCLLSEEPLCLYSDIWECSYNDN